jgi:AcrR family transcriptional regulator
MTDVRSTTEPRWRRMPEERPRQILDAALAVFGERGLADARLDDIARRAGLSKGTIYLYFPNKEELFREVVRQTIIRGIEEAEQVAPAGSAIEELRGHMRSYWTFLRSPVFEVLHRLVQIELHQFPDLAEFYAREVVQRTNTLLCRVLERGMKAGEIRPMDPMVAARMLMALFVTHAVWCRRREFFRAVADKTDAQIFTELMDFYFTAIGLPPAASCPGANS